MFLKKKKKKNKTWTNWEPLHLSLLGRMPRHNGAIGAVGAVVLGGKFMGAALAEWETKWGEISKGGSRWRGGLSSWSGEIGGCCMWPPSIPPHKLLPVRTSGWDMGLRCLRRERGCPHVPDSLAGLSLLRKWRLRLWERGMRLCGCVWEEERGWTCVWEERG